MTTCSFKYLILTAVSVLSPETVSVWAQDADSALCLTITITQQQWHLANVSAPKYALFFLLLFFFE